MRTHVVIAATVLLDAGLLGANATIAAWSGSRTVLGQAIFAAADMIASALLLWGLHVSRRPADMLHPFGRGREMFFWAFLATFVTFVIAGLAAFVPGLVQALRPSTIDHLGAALAVVLSRLATSVAGIWVTMHELKLGGSTVKTLIDSAHQGLKAVFYQDIVMAIGCSVALTGLLAVGLTQWFWIDGFAASLEGALLVATGLALTVETRDYLVGKAIPAEMRRGLLDLAERHPGVGSVRGVDSIVLGAEEALLALRINFSGQMTAAEIEANIRILKARLGEAYPSLRHIIIEPTA